MVLVRLRMDSERLHGEGILPGSPLRLGTGNEEGRRRPAGREMQRAAGEHTGMQRAVEAHKGRLHEAEARMRHPQEVAHKEKLNEGEHWVAHTGKPNEGEHQAERTEKPRVATPHRLGRET